MRASGWPRACGKPTPVISAIVLSTYADVTYAFKLFESGARV
jgi:hypothetical protein